MTAMAGLYSNISWHSYISDLHAFHVFVHNVFGAHGTIDVLYGVELHLKLYNMLCILIIYVQYKLYKDKVLFVLVLFCTLLYP